MTDLKQPPKLLFKQRSWSPDIQRDIEWQNLKSKQLRRFRHRHRRSKSIDATPEVTDDDLRELKACFDLGFGFDFSSDLDPKLSLAFPALELYAAVNRKYNSSLLLSRSSSLSSDSSSSSSSSSTSSNLISTIIDPSDDPEKMKTKLKQWAQVVSCSILEASSQTTTEMLQKRKM